MEAGHLGQFMLLFSRGKKLSKVMTNQNKNQKGTWLTFRAIQWPWCTCGVQWPTALPMHPAFQGSQLNDLHNLAIRAFSE
uniref:Uncharacterized protein n=1 Tax=Anguilla anguilla TaxID=7936 RepID=A0A0E9PKE3_ANGAN